MAILSATYGITGLAGVSPNLFMLDTTDSVATVTTAGYLNALHSEGALALSNKVVALVTTEAAGVFSTSWYKVVVTGAAGNFVYSLVAI